jgi:hypothetical protein
LVKNVHLNVLFLLDDIDMDDIKGSGYIVKPFIQDISGLAGT